MCPVNPTNLTFPCWRALSSASTAPPLREVLRRLVVEDHFVNLPEIQIVGLQAAERVLELPHGGAGIAPVHAGLGHQEDLVAASDQRLAHARLAHALVVVPRVVHEGDAAVDGRMDEPGRLPLRLRQAEVPAAERQNRDRDARSSERARGDFNRRLRHVTSENMWNAFDAGSRLLLPQRGHGCPFRSSAPSDSRSSPSGSRTDPSGRRAPRSSA